MTYLIDEDTKLQYAGLYLITLLADSNLEASSLIKEDEDLLEPIILWLVDKEYIDIKDQDTLSITGKGTDIIVQFKARYQKFLYEYDVFCAVDLESGEFAMKYYHEHTSLDEWVDFLDQERWDDLRIALAEYENIDPIEVIFMSFLNEKRYGRDDNGWDYDRLLGDIWSEISDIYNTSIKLKELAYEDGNESIPAEDVIKDIFTQGTQLMQKLKKNL